MGVDRLRFSPPLLNALSSFTVEAALRRRMGTESFLSCVGPETGLVDEATAGGCHAPVVVAARKDPHPSTAARRANTATMADADCRRDHRERNETPKLTVSLRLPAAMPHLARRHASGAGHIIRGPPKPGTAPTGISANPMTSRMNIRNVFRVGSWSISGRRAANRMNTVSTSNATMVSHRVQS
jgi:hypothetical protein